jgi:hypothetical protein
MAFYTISSLHSKGGSSTFSVISKLVKSSRARMNSLKFSGQALDPLDLIFLLLWVMSMDQAQPSIILKLI